MQRTIDWRQEKEKNKYKRRRQNQNEQQAEKQARQLERQFSHTDRVNERDSE